VVELAERRVIPVLGAGVSASCVNAGGDHPPDWTTFLVGMARALPDAALGTMSEALIAEHRLLDAAEVIRASLPAADFARYIRDTLSVPGFEPSEWHRLVQRLDAKIVMTLNYDDLYERQCVSGAAAASYAVHRYSDPHLLNSLRSDMRVVVKAHGCISDPDRIVLSRSGYFATRRDYGPFHAILGALCLTSTLLFLGCGFGDDPDVQLALQNATIAAPSSHQHYALIDDRYPQSVFTAMSEAYNIDFVRYPSGDHSAALAALRDLAEQVDARRYAVAWGPI